MKKSLKIQGIVLACLLGTSSLLAVPAVSAQSLWSDADGTSMGLFADRKARNVGDILTVVISESTSTSAKKSGTDQRSPKTPSSAQTRHRL